MIDNDLLNAAALEMLHALQDVQECLACYRDNQEYKHRNHGVVSLEEFKYLVVDPAIAAATGIPQ